MFQAQSRAELTRSIIIIVAVFPRSRLGISFIGLFVIVSTLRFVIRPIKTLTDRCQIIHNVPTS